MKPIQSFLGRRQFLIGSVASASALAFTKLVKGNRIAAASDSPGSVARESGAVGTVYPHLLSPLRVRNRILKNRIMHTPGVAGLLSGPERYPNDIVPCVKCHDCHSRDAVCPVNPTLGMSETIIRSIPSPFSSRKVVVIGGGPRRYEGGHRSCRKGSQGDLV